MWPVEDIPAEALLYMRVHKMWCRDGDVLPGAFSNHGDDTGRPGMSTDWEKYSTPEDTRNRTKRDPLNYGVVKMIAGRVRGIPDQTVEHTPVHPDNRAHTDVFGDKDSNPEVRVLLRRASDWAIRLPA